jgi:putative mRNA 3-end processing factor
MRYAAHTPLLRNDGSGFYCEAGGFHIDPWNPVARAVITHGHADHYAYGCESYLVAAEGETVFRARLGVDAPIQTLGYGQSIDINGVRVSMHPAGHILGSAQIRVEHRGEVWVVSGDYKRQPDPTCAPFEPVRCDTFITEATFGLPVYRWPDPAEEIARINAWWRANADAGKSSLLFCYALGKAQRVIASVDPAIGPILTHGSVERLNRAYREAGIALPPTHYAMQAERADMSRALVIAPLSARGTTWTRRFGSHASGFVSGWMRIRGARRRRAVDRGFVLSDHVDWPGLMASINETGAGRILVTHGYINVVARWLNEAGYDATAVETRYTSSDTEDAEQLNMEEEE